MCVYFASLVVHLTRETIFFWGGFLWSDRFCAKQMHVQHVKQLLRITAARACDSTQQGVALMVNISVCVFVCLTLTLSLSRCHSFSLYLCVCVCVLYMSVRMAMNNSLCVCVCAFAYF